MESADIPTEFIMTIALDRPTNNAHIVQPVSQPAPPKRSARPGRALRVITRITLGISSAIWLVVMLALAVSASAPGFALCFGLAIVPVPMVLAAFRWIDRAEPEPGRNLLVAFLWGATTAAVISIAIELLWDVPGWLSAPIVEELAKGSILVLMVLFVRSRFDGVVDGIVYAGVVATGFAFTENIAYFTNSYLLGLAPADGAVAVNGQGHTSDVFISFALRGVVLPFSHPLFTVMFGIGVGLAVVSAKRAMRIIAPVVGLAAAIALHMLWDYVLLGTDPGSTVLLALVALFALVFVAMIWIISRVRRHELRSTEQHLQSYALQGWFAESELPALSSFKGRRQARRWAASVSGTQGKRAITEIQHAATKLGLLHRKLAVGRSVPDFATSQQTLLVKLAGARTVLALSQAFPIVGVAGNRPRLLPAA
jgi:RsiW-degrading membrane proteinase PrsW (M82 family)